VAIAEADGSLVLAKWDPRGTTSGYSNDHVRVYLTLSTCSGAVADELAQVLLVKSKDYQISEVREYLDQMNKLLAAGTIYMFPFFY
jgi:hypothetical protein